VRVPFIDLAAQARNLGGTLEEAVATVLASQQFVLGPHVERFEDAMASYCGVRHALGVGSGTDALILALGALGVGPGTRVITTPFSFMATASAIARLGARPVFADVDAETLNLDPQAVGRILDTAPERVVGIVPVHLFGRIAAMGEFGMLAARTGTWVVEDAAQALGARLPVGAAGALGRAGCLSFYPTKNLGGVGDGGMVLTNEDVVAERVRRDRAQGTVAPYRHESLGMCSRLDGVNAAALTVKLAELDRWNARRRAVAAAYDAGFRAAGLCGRLGAPLQLPALGGAAHVFHQYVVRAHDRDALATHLHAGGIATQIFYPVPLHRQPALAGLADVPFGMPVAERAAEEVLALPIYAEITDDQVRAVIDAVRAFYAATQRAL
jgi:dTDP-4-amino-4,6-dideoxygalactose transaminase